jgi:hypothetical protein
MGGAQAPFDGRGVLQSESITGNDRIRAMPPEFFDPTPEEQNLVLIDAAQSRAAYQLLREL